VSRSVQPSAVQLEILQVLWARGEALVADVHAALAARRKVAPTTVATLLRRMERRGLVTHRVDGRQFVYRAKRTEAGTRTAMVDDLTERLFAGDRAALVSHLLDVRRVDRADLARFRAELARREKERGGGKGGRDDR